MLWMRKLKDGVKTLSQQSNAYEESASKNSRSWEYAKCALYVGLIYAFFGFLITELIVNPLRISRLTGIDLEIVNTISMVIMVMALLGLIAFSVVAQTKLLYGHFIDLMVPVFAVLVLVISVVAFAYAFPMRHPLDDPGPGAGVILILFFIGYFIIIVVSTLVGFFYHRMTKRKA